MDFKKLLELFDRGLNKKNITNLLIIALVGVLIVLGASIFRDTTTSGSNSSGSNSSGSNKTNGTATTTDTSYEGSIQNYENNKKNELKTILQEIEGVGRVDVMLYIESSEEQVPAINNSVSDSQTQEKDNTGGTRTTTTNNNGSNIVVTNGENGSTSPLILKTYLPKITGVVITAEGADNNMTKLQIIEAVSQLFNISPDKVNVYHMKQ